MSVPERAQRPPAWQRKAADGAETISLEGDWIAQLGQIPDYTPAPAGTDAIVRFDTAGLGQWDTGLIGFLWAIKRDAAQGGRQFDDASLPQAAQKLLALLPDRLAPPRPAPRRPFQPLTRLGAWTIGLFAEAGFLSEMTAFSVRGAVAAMAGRARMRLDDLLQNIRDAGPSALVIVGVVNLLVGAILAFVGAVQLRRFAADIFVANLVGLAVVREMAAVMTAIVMAGRTGGAYAARIATMRGNEELDALAVVGIPISEYIVLPSVLALTITLPLLYLYGCLMGLLGGGLVALLMLNVTVAGFMHQLIAAVPLNQFGFGFIKAVTFAILIAIASCRIGLLAGRSAADVGLAATRAVVIGIVGVIVVDAIYAVLADAVGI